MTLAVVPNVNTSWYEPGRISGDPVITQNLNYTGGANTLKSTTKVSVRLVQDMLKRHLPSTIRQGLGVGVSSPDLTVAVGDAIINGRWVLNTTQADFDASVLGDGTYYLHLTLTEDAEGVDRDPQNESIVIEATLVGSYGAATSNRIVLAKFSVSSSVPSLIASYTGTPAQWAAAAIVPPISPDGSVYGSVEIYSGAIERNLEAVAEADGFRITEKLIIDDTDGTPVGKAHLRNIDQELEARNAPSVDNDYVPFHAKSLKIDGQEVITSSQALTNIPSINSKTVPAGASELLDRDTAPSERVKNKEFEDGTTLIVDAAVPTSKMRFEVSGVTPLNTRVVTMIDEDLEIVGRTNEQTLTQKTLTAPIIGPTGWTNANHNHSATNRGAQITDAALSAAVTVSKGGTGVATLEDGGILIGNVAGVVQVTARPTAGQILIGQTSGDPLLKSITGSQLTIDKEGVAVVVNDAHSHNTQYYTESEINALKYIGSGNKGITAFHPTGAVYDVIPGINYCRLVNASGTGHYYYQMTTADVNWVRFNVDLPPMIGSKKLYITSAKMYLYAANGTHYAKQLWMQWYTKTGQDDGIGSFYTLNWNSSGAKSYALSENASVDPGALIVRVEISLASNFSDLSFSPLLLEYYYD